MGVSTAHSVKSRTKNHFTNKFKSPIALLYSRKWLIWAVHYQNHSMKFIIRAKTLRNSQWELTEIKLRACFCCELRVVVAPSQEVVFVCVLIEQFNLQILPRVVVNQELETKIAPKHTQKRKRNKLCLKCETAHCFSLFHNFPIIENSKKDKTFLLNLHF